MYDHQKLDVINVVGQTLVPAANFGLFYVGYQPIVIDHLWATVTVVSAAAISVATWKYRPTPGSDTGSSTIGTLSIPVATAPGKSVYKKLATVFTALPGSEITVTTTGAATGNATMGFTCHPSWDAPTNNANMIASA